MSTLTRNLLVASLAMMMSLSSLTVSAMPEFPVDPAPAAMAMDMVMDHCQQQDERKHCGHCDDMHQCNAAHSGCVSTVAIPAYFNQPLAFPGHPIPSALVRDKHPLQLISLLFRPPISA